MVVGSKPGKKGSHQPHETEMNTPMGSKDWRPLGLEHESGGQVARVETWKGRFSLQKGGLIWKEDGWYTSLPSEDEELPAFETRLWLALCLPGTVTARGAMRSGLGIITLWCPRSLKRNSEWSRSSFTSSTGRTAVTTTSPWSDCRDRTSSAPGSAATFCRPVCRSGGRGHRRPPPTVTSQGGETQVRRWRTGKAVAHRRGGDRHLLASRARWAVT